MTMPQALHGPGWRETAHMLNWPMDQANQATSIAILCEPERPAHTTGVIILSGGAQTRWGAHRQFVQMARHCAQQGWPALRFDWPGLGDATGNCHHFETLAPLVSGAIAQLLSMQPGLQSVVLLGLCDGASVALMSIQSQPDARVKGLALINPWVRTEHSLARTHLKHYYWSRLRQPDFWLKLLRGGVGGAALRDLLGSVKRGTQRPDPGPADAPTRMAQGWRAFDGPILAVVSDQDTTGQEFMLQARQGSAWRPTWANPQAQLVLLTEADHTCSSPSAQAALLRALSGWLADHHARQSRQARPPA